MTTTDRRVREVFPLLCLGLLIVPQLARAQTVTRSVDSDGVEVATVDRLPRLTSRDWFWGTEVELEISTQPGGPLEEPTVYNPTDLILLSADSLLVVDGQGDLHFAILDTKTGEPLSRFGRRGEGPEEISQVGAVWIRDDGEVAVFDPMGPRVSIFSRSGQLQETGLAQFVAYQVSLAQPGQPGPLVQRITWPEDQPPYFSLHRLLKGESGDDWDYVPRQLALLPSRSEGDGFQDGRPMWTATRGGIIVGRSDQAMFQVLDPNGDPIRRIVLPLSRRELRQREIDEQMRRLGVTQLALEPGQIGISNALYAFGDSIFGMYQSRLWRAAEDPELSEEQRLWRLVSITGEYMGVFERSAGFEPLWFDSDGMVWGVAEDSVGTPVIQKRRLVPPPTLR